MSCVTVLLRKLAHNAFHFQIILLSSSGHSIYNSDELIPLKFINFKVAGTSFQLFDSLLL